MHAWPPTRQLDCLTSVPAWLLVPADDVVKLLSDLFTLFDKATRVNSIYKLQTCGLLGGVRLVVGRLIVAVPVSVQDRRRVCVRVGSGLHAAGSNW